MKVVLFTMATVALVAAASTHRLALTCKPTLTSAGSGINGIAAETDAYLNWRNDAELAYGTPYKNWMLAKNRGRDTHKIKFGKWSANAYGNPCKI